MKRFKSIVWAIIATVLIAICWATPVVAKLIASIFILAIAGLNIFLGPTINTIKDNVKEEIESNGDAE